MKKLSNVFVVLVEKLGLSFLNNLNGLGRIIFFGSKFFYWLPKSPFRLKELVSQLYDIGNRSLFIIALSGLLLEW